MKKPASLGYRQRAAKLREFGFNVSYGKRGKTSTQGKAAVSRAWNKVSKYVENEKQKFVFVPDKGKLREEATKGLTKAQVTKAGFFLRVPKGAKKAPTLKLKGDGVLEYKATGKSGASVIETIHRISPELLMEDPPRAILALGKKKDKVVLTVNGFDSSQTTEYTLDALAYYLANTLLPKFLDPNLEEEFEDDGEPKRARRMGRKAKEEKLKQFTDIFHVKVIRHSNSTKNERSSKRRRR